jgi:hypothetical protein
LSIGFRILISRHPAIQTTGRLTLAPAGLSPAEHTSLYWTHNRALGSRVTHSAPIRQTYRSCQPTPLLIVDEFQSFGTTVFSPILAEARKYGLCLTLAHQFAAQLTEQARAAILGNASTFLVLKISPEDAEPLAPIFNLDHQQFSPTALTTQHPFQAWIKRDFYNFQAPADLSGSSLRIFLRRPAEFCPGPSARDARQPPNHRTSSH